ncbi:MAG TPA: hypothetical protein VGP76_12175 [Planctomycetaceae bacterium]|jgi:hypothetical protein|nr:hypothetical protein [Planctomycetaceae bacterium]
MARKTPSRMELRRQVEAAGEAGAAAEKTAKKRVKTKDGVAKKPSTRRTKTKVAERKRLMWAVYNGSMKEEGRFAYDQRDSAEEKVQQLKLKSPKKIFFIQAIKETIIPPAKPAEAAATK